eukprot:gene32722-40387_t
MDVHGTSGQLVAFSGSRTAAAGDDGKLAVYAGGNPRQICYDKTNDVMYVSCPSDSIIRAVNKDGILSTVAGTIGVDGENGLGGLAINALIQNPTNCAVDISGNLYVIQDGFNVVRVVNQDTKTWNNFIGTYGSEGYEGDGGQATSALISFPVDYFTPS